MVFRGNTFGVSEMRCSVQRIFILILILWTSESRCNNPTVDEHLFRGLLISLGKAYNFYDQKYKDINLDGIYGLRVSEGALIKILDEQKSGILKLDKETVSRISSLQREASLIAKKSLPVLQKNYPSYFKKFEVAISGPWKNFKSFRKLDHSLYIPIDKRSEISFDEDTSDQCMTEMTGTGDTSSKPCELSAHCWNLMTSKGAGGYALTHQALFLLIGELHGCKKNLLKKLKELNNGISLQGVYDRICASMYPQMLEYEKKKSSSNYERDLYMEQGMVCGSMGYDKFLSPDRLKRILGWQRKSGCYGDLDDKKDARYFGESSRDDVEHLHLGQNMINENAYGKNGLKKEKMLDRSQGDDVRLGGTGRKLMSMRTMRSLLVEKALDGGCMSHLTGVATGTLGVYLRWASHLKFPGPLCNHTKDKSTAKEDQSYHNQKSAGHSVYLRKMMQKENEPVLKIANAKQVGNHGTHGISMTTSAGFLIVLVVVLLVVYGTLTRKRLLNKAWVVLQRRKTSHVI